MSDVTRILSQIEQGDSQAAEKLLPLVYNELRRLARINLSQEQQGQTLQPTALVHEAYLRLVAPDDHQHWDSRGHFFSAAAEAMRRILVENARRKARVKHGGDLERAALADVAGDDIHAAEELLQLEEALTRLSVEEPEKAKLVKLRYFAGLTIEDAADVLGISRATAARHWTYARAWLYNALARD